MDTTPMWRAVLPVMLKVDGCERLALFVDAHVVEHTTEEIFSDLHDLGFVETPHPSGGVLFLSPAAAAARARGETVIDALTGKPIEALPGVGRAPEARR